MYKIQRETERQQRTTANTAPQHAHLDRQHGRFSDNDPITVARELTRVCADGRGEDGRGEEHCDEHCDRGDDRQQ